MTIAEEVSVNALVDGPLPGNPILLEQYPCLPPRDESTEDRYERLLADTRPHPDPETTDDHNTWRRQVQDAGPLASLAASAAVAGAWGGLTPDQRSEVPQRVAEAAKAAVQQSTATVDWRKVLERYVGRSLTRRPTYNRPPRRFPEMVGIIPGRMQGVGSPRVLACIDTSGSISPADIADFSSELGRMARSCVVTVVFFDERVRDVFSYRKFSEVTGRGGTDFRPILKPDFLRNHRTDCVVIFTDGQGPAPALKPCVPVVWCLTGRGRSPVAWGKSIAISGT